MTMESTGVGHSSRASDNPRLGFPWGICVGQLAHGDQCAGNAFLPTDAGGMVVRFDLANQQAAANLIETAALSLIDALPHRAMEASVVDFAIRKRFSRLSELAPLRQYRIHDTPQAARKALEECEALARYRHHELLNDETPTLETYNRVGQGFERYRLLLVNLNDFPIEARDRDQALTLFDAAFEAGIYIVAYVNTETLPAPEVGKEQQAFWTMLSRRYPVVGIGADQRLTIENPGKGAALIEAAKAQGLELSAPQIELAELLAHRRSLAEHDDDAQRDFLSIPIGRTPDGRHEVAFSFGARSDCNHAFIVGMSGSGKTTLLNNLIVGIAERYGSDELRLFLMDYKDGVEFQVFAEHPNCEKIFLDNRDLDAARRLLQDFVDTIDERGRLFREVGVKDVDAWNALPESARGSSWQRMPRLLLIVDEVQRLFTDDAAGRNFNALLKDVVKRGRAFGTHIVLSTQTLINANIDRDLMSQIALRIAFKLNNDTDCDRIFGYGNGLPKHLERYEFIYNPDSGHREANSRARALPPPEVAARLAAACAARSAAQSVRPEIVHSVVAEKAQASDAPVLTGFVPTSPSSGTGWLSESPDEAKARARAERNRRQAEILAQFRARQTAGEIESLGQREPPEPA